MERDIGAYMRQAEQLMREITEQDRKFKAEIAETQFRLRERTS